MNNALSHLRLMFTVHDIDDTLERLRNRSAQLLGEVVERIGSATSAALRGF